MRIYNGKIVLCGSRNLGKIECWRGGTGFCLEISSGRCEEKFIEMPESAELPPEITVAVAGFAGDAGGHHRIEIRDFQGRRIFDALFGISALSKPKSTHGAHVNLRYADRSIECGDGAEAKIAPFEPEKPFHTESITNNGVFDADTTCESPAPTRSSSHGLGDWEHP